MFALCLVYVIQIYNSADTDKSVRGMEPGFKEGQDSRSTGHMRPPALAAARPARITPAGRQRQAGVRDPGRPARLELRHALRQPDAPCSFTRARSSIRARSSAAFATNRAARRRPAGYRSAGASLARPSFCRLNRSLASS